MFVNYLQQSELNMHQICIKYRAIEDSTLIIAYYNNNKETVTDTKFKKNYCNVTEIHTKNRTINIFSKYVRRQ